MIIRTDAFVLRQYHLRETSLIVTLYTAACGKVKGVVKGVRQQKSKTASHFELLNKISATIYEKPQRDLQLISDSALLSFYEGIKKDIATYVYAVYGLELVDMLTQPHLPNDLLFRLISVYLSGLSQENMHVYPSAFTAKLLKVSGLFPNLSECCVCKKKAIADVFFSYRQGGVVCGDDFNAFEDHEGMLISHDIVKCLYLLVKEPFEKCMSLQDQEILTQAGTILHTYVQYMSDNKLKTPHIVHELGLPLFTRKEIAKANGT